MAALLKFRLCPRFPYPIPFPLVRSKPEPDRLLFFLF